MQVAYQLQGDELNLNLLESIKSLFQNKEIEIIVHDLDEEDKKFGDILEYSLANTQTVSKELLFKALNEN
ncbi:MAG: hypothetical protein RBT59_06780 [Arcobacteraceae bacterium]|jgi:hypothetical protein|nr:hypothetical protein [Arcobacteraceae bacterium]